MRPSSFLIMTVAALLTAGIIVTKPLCRSKTNDTPQIRKSAAVQEILVAAPNNMKTFPKSVLSLP